MCLFTAFKFSIWSCLAPFQLLCASDPTQGYSTLILGVFPLHHIAIVGVTKRVGLKLFGREIILEVLQPK